MGEEAVQAVVTRSTGTATELFRHDRPEGPACDPYSDVTKMTLPAVMQSFQYLTGMLAYSTVELAKRDAEVTALDFYIKVRQKTLILQASGRTKKKYDLDAEVATDAETVKLTTKRMEVSTLKTMLEATTKGIEQKAALMSREITRRQMESDRTRNNH